MTSPLSIQFVIPVETGTSNELKILDSRLRGNDGNRVQNRFSKTC